MPGSVDDKSVELCFRLGTLFLEALDRPLLPDRTDAASRVFSPLESPLESNAELLGLSVFIDLLLLLPGILDRSERKDREESLVSDRLIDGYD